MTWRAEAVLVTTSSAASAVTPVGCSLRWLGSDWRRRRLLGVTADSSQLVEVLVDDGSCRALASLPTAETNSNFAASLDATCERLVFVEPRGRIAALLLASMTTLELPPSPFISTAMLAVVTPRDSAAYVAALAAPGGAALRPSASGAAPSAGWAASTSSGSSAPLRRPPLTSASFASDGSTRDPTSTDTVVVVVNDGNSLRLSSLALVAAAYLLLLNEHTALE